MLNLSKLAYVDPGVVTYVRDAATTAKLLERNDVDAIEIHTNGRYSFVHK